MNGKRNIIGFKILLFFGVLAQGAFSDGYRNPPPTAEGIGKSGANMVFVDDASAISYNPANLAFQTNASIVVNATLAQSKNTFDNAYPAAPTAVSDDPWIVLPNLYASLPLAEGIVAGLGITTPYGQGIEWNSMDVFNGYAPLSLYDAKISLININPTMAFKLADTLSVGVGADIFYSELELKAFLGANPPPVPPAPPAAPVGDAKGEGDGWGIGGNIGLTWQMTEKQRVALSYRSQVNMDYNGDFSVNGTVVGDFSTTIKYPNTVGLGYGIQLTDTIQVEGLLEWLEWSINDVQSINVSGLPPPPIDPQVNNWDDTITVAIGGSWQFAEGWVFRTGYTFIESPIPDNTITPILPDTDRHVIGLGLGYTVQGHTVDISYSFSFYEDRTSTNPAYPGTYEIDSNLVGLTYSYSF